MPELTIGSGTYRAIWATVNRRPGGGREVVLQIPGRLRLYPGDRGRLEHRAGPNCEIMTVEVQDSAYEMHGSGHTSVKLLESIPGEHRGLGLFERFEQAQGMAGVEPRHVVMDEIDEWTAALADGLKRESSAPLPSDIHGIPWNWATDWPAQPCMGYGADHWPAVGHEIMVIDGEQKAWRGRVQDLGGNVVMCSMRRPDGTAVPSLVHHRFTAVVHLLPSPPTFDNPVDADNWLAAHDPVVRQMFPDGARVIATLTFSDSIAGPIDREFPARVVKFLPHWTPTAPGYLVLLDAWIDGLPRLMETGVLRWPDT